MKIEANTPSPDAIFDEHLQKFSQISISAVKSVEQNDDKATVQSFRPPLPLETFTGREKELQQLQQAFSNSHSTSVVIQRSQKKVSGTGGIGKTQLAIQFANNVLNQKVFSNVIWLNADCSEFDQLRLQFNGLASVLNIETEKQSFDDVLNIVFYMLSEKGNTLLVFDNASSLEDLKFYLPASHHSISVLVTTRDNNTWQNTFEQLTLDVFTLDEALSFIKKTLGTHYQKDQAKLLAETLGCYPLALAQATAYILTRHINLETFLSLFDAYKQKCLDKSPLSTDPHQETLWVTVNLCLEQINHVGAINMLTACTNLAPESPIDIDLLNMWSDHPDNCESNLKLLQCYSFFEQTSLNGYVKMHKLVQEIIQIIDNRAIQHSWLLNTVDRISIHYEIQLTPAKDMKRQKYLMPHLSKLISVLEQHASDEHKNIALIKLYLAAEYIKSGMPSKSVDLYQEALETIAVLFGKTHDSYAAVLANLGGAYGEISDPEKAHQYLSRSLDILKTNKSSNFHLLLTIGQNLASSCTERGKIGEALNHYAYTLELAKMLHGPNHPEVAKVLVNLAGTHLANGDPTQSMINSQRALKILEMEFGPESFLVAATLMNIGIAYTNMGMPKMALPVLQRALDITQKIFSPNHPKVASLLVNLGNAYIGLGDPKKAEPYFVQALKIKELTFGLNHLEVASVLTNLSCVYLDLEEPMQAKKFVERALPIKLSIYGENHPELSTLYTNLGSAYTYLGDIEKGRVYFQHALECVLKKYDDDHIEVAKALANIGSAYSKQQDHQQALMYHNKALPILTRTFGPDHPQTAMTVLSISTDLKNLDQNEEALAGFKRCATIFQKHFGLEHPHTKYALAMEFKLFLAIEAKKKIFEQWKTSDLGDALRQATLNGTVEDCQNIAAGFPGHINKQDEKGDTPLHIAIKNRSVKKVRFLLEYGAKCDIKDNHDKTPLDYIFNPPFPPLISELMNYLLDKYHTFKIEGNQCEQLVRICAANNDLLGMKILHCCHISIDSPGPKSGRTALHFAVVRKHVDCVRWLIKEGADPNRCDKNGNTAIDLAIGEPELISILTNDRHQRNTVKF